MESAPPSTREQLTALEIRYSRIESLDAASQFLSLLLKALFLDARRPVDEDIIAIPHCSQLLHTHPQLYHAIQSARLAEDWTQVTDSPYIPPFVSSPARSCLDYFRPTLKKAIDGRLLEPWEPRKHTDYTDEATFTFLESLHLYQESKYLSIILHDLGGFHHDEVLRERVSNIFTTTNKFLVNASGNGKTRLCYEGLCSNWGFYLSGHIDDGRLGSYDLQLLLRECRTDLMDKDVSQKLQVMTNLFGAILLTRLLVFLMFLQEAAVDEAEFSDETKKRWLTTQLLPRNLADRNTEPFEEVTRKLMEHDCTYLAENITIALRKIRTFIGEDPLFIVLDEASYVVDMYSHHFNDTPLLQIILQTWTDLTKGQCPIICAGIKIPRERFADGAGSDFAWTSNTGSFDDPLRQEQYVSQFLPPAFRESPAGRFLIARTWRWLRGRHRFTATFVAFLLVEGLHFPHTHLDKYMEHAVSFRPMDAVECVGAEGEAPIWAATFYPIKIRGVSEEDKNLFLEILLRYLATHNASPLLGEDQIPLMYRDLARFQDGNFTELVLDEPTPLLVIARTLFPFPTRPISGGPNKNPATFIQSLRRNIPRTSESLAYYLVFYLTQALGKGDRLDRIFPFPRGSPQWAAKPATLVRFYRTESDEVEWSPVAADDFESFRPLAHQAVSIQDTLSWMEHRVGTVFCLPHSSNADLLFAIQLADGNFVWVALKALLTQEPVRLSDLQATLSGLNANEFFQGVGETTQSQLQRVFDALPNSGSCKVLRAICAFPIEIPRLDEDAVNVYEDIDTTDVAIVNISAFESRPSQVMQTDLFDAIVAGVLAGHKRKSRWESSDENTLWTSRKRLKLEYLTEREQKYVTWPEARWDGPIVYEEEFEEVEETPIQTRRKPTQRSKGSKKVEASTRQSKRISKKLTTTQSTRGGKAKETVADADTAAESSRKPGTKRKTPPVDEPEVVTIDLDKTPAQNTRRRSKKA
ncbi:hypothetical protein MIND_00887300 [Mycena indigotica]|uniref:Uncharacterized protein n=1 Tax=Mycena indigotica TaxID=2126181 RepID=A0A8H6SKA5_9AGAR|nr:uncharacterized protein MIND_00887300 [Mycena indigotica]KAF7299380.1 hypothetical protein MIND_00887300 [Mycena indigotica]